MSFFVSFIPLYFYGYFNFSYRIFSTLGLSKTFHFSLFLLF